MTVTINGNGTITPVSAVNPAGSILQVTNTTVTAVSLISISSNWVDSAITCALTPASSSNKILINSTITGEGNAANQQRFGYRIKKAISGGATTYLTGAAAGSRSLLTGLTGDLTDNATTTASTFSFSNYLDSPSTTSAVTYTIQFTYENAGGSATYYLNSQVSDSDASANARYVSWITLMEVAG
jgi:hypothetical protein